MSWTLVNNGARVKDEKGRTIADLRYAACDVKRKYLIAALPDIMEALAHQVCRNHEFTLNCSACRLAEEIASGKFEIKRA